MIVEVVKIGNATIKVSDESYAGKTKEEYEKIAQNAWLHMIENVIRIKTA